MLMQPELSPTTAMASISCDFAYYYCCLPRLLKTYRGCYCWFGGPPGAAPLTLVGAPNETTFTGIVTRIHGFSYPIITSLVCFFEVGRLLFAPCQKGAQQSSSISYTSISIDGLLAFLLKGLGAGTYPIVSDPVRSKPFES